MHACWAELTMAPTSSAVPGSTEHAASWLLELAQWEMSSMYDDLALEAARGYVSVRPRSIMPVDCLLGQKRAEDDDKKGSGRREGERRTE